MSARKVDQIKISMKKTLLLLMIICTWLQSYAQVPNRSPFNVFWGRASFGKSADIPPAPGTMLDLGVNGGKEAVLFRPFYKDSVHTPLKGMYGFDISCQCWVYYDSLKWVRMKLGTGYGIAANDSTSTIDTSIIATKSAITIDNAAQNNNVSRKSLQVSNKGPVKFSDTNSMRVDIINGKGAATYSATSYGGNALIKFFLAGGDSLHPTYPAIGQQACVSAHTFSFRSDGTDSFSTAGMFGLVVKDTILDSNSNPMNFKVQQPLKGQLHAQSTQLYINDTGVTELYNVKLIKLKQGALTDKIMVWVNDSTLAFLPNSLSYYQASKTDTFTIPNNYIVLGSGVNRTYNGNVWYDPTNNTLYVGQPTAISNITRAANFRHDGNSFHGVAAINGYNGTSSSGGFAAYGDSTQIASNVYPAMFRKASPNWASSGGINANDAFIFAGSSGNIVVKPNNATGNIYFIGGNGGTSYVYIDPSQVFHADAIVSTSTLTTAQPSANGASAMKFGKVLSGGDGKKYQEVSIDGVLYYKELLTSLP